MINYAKILHNIFKQHMFWIFVRIAILTNIQNICSMRTRPLLNIILSIKDSLEQRIHYNGNIFGNKCCRCNEGSLYHKPTQTQTLIKQHSSV